MQEGAIAIGGNDHRLGRPHRRAKNAEQDQWPTGQILNAAWACRGVTPLEGCCSGPGPRLRRWTAGLDRHGRLAADGAWATAAGASAAREWGRALTRSASVVRTALRWMLAAVGRQRSAMARAHALLLSDSMRHARPWRVSVGCVSDVPGVSWHRAPDGNRVDCCDWPASVAIRVHGWTPAHAGVGYRSIALNHRARLAV